jgi:ABC-type transporter Mla maintaining outer membrane lipid asymmetry ATPase subunit MlaF
VLLVEGLVVERGPFRLSIEALSIPRGRATLLLGPTGAGKSTLFSVLARLERPWLGGAAEGTVEGRVVFAPREGGAMDLLALTERRILGRRIRGSLIGAVLQQNGLFTGLGVLANVTWPLRRRGLEAGEAREAARAALARTGGPPEDRAVAHLSGGEAKRLAVARALALEPEVLLLDEPFAGLDPASLEAMIGLVSGLPPEVTPVVITHQPRAVRALADRVVILRPGGLEWEGEAAEAGDRIERFLARVREEQG